MLEVTFGHDAALLAVLNGKFVYDTLYATPTIRAHSSTSIRLTDTIIITSFTIKLIHTFISPLLSTHHCHSFSRESTYYRSHKRYLLSAHAYPYKCYLLSAHALSLQQICYIASTTAGIWLCIPVIKSNYFLFTTTCAHSSEVASMIVAVLRRWNPTSIWRTFPIYYRYGNYVCLSGKLFKLSTSRRRPRYLF